MKCRFCKRAPKRPQDSWKGAHLHHRDDEHQCGENWKSYNIQRVVQQQVTQLQIDAIVAAAAAASVNDEPEGSSLPTANAGQKRKEGPKDGNPEGVEGEIAEDEDEGGPPTKKLRMD